MKAIELLESHGNSLSVVELMLTTANLLIK